MENRGFKLYRRFRAKKGLPLSVYKSTLKSNGLNINATDLKSSIMLALQRGFVEKKKQRYRIPWKLCDFHIARMLGVTGLPFPRPRSISTISMKELISTDEVSSITIPSSVPSTDVNADGGGMVVEDSNVECEPDTGAEFIVKSEDDKGERRSAHYLITDCWNSMEGFFGVLEMRNIKQEEETKPVLQKYGLNWPRQPITSYD